MGEVLRSTNHLLLPRITASTQRERSALFNKTIISFARGIRNLPTREAIALPAVGETAPRVHNGSTSKTTTEGTYGGKTLTQLYPYAPKGVFVYT